MPFASPDDGVGLSTNQSVIFTEDWQILSDGISRKNCVMQGCLVTATTLMTLDVGLGSVLSNRDLFPVANATVVIGTADATNPRFDYVVINSAGAKAVRAGTAAATPNPPALTAADVVLAVVYVPAAATTLTSANIYDRRMLQEGGPITIASNLANVTFSNSTALNAFITQTIPASLLSRPQGTSGFSKLRVRFGGSYLVTSAFNVTLKIVFGGVTMFQDVTSSYNAHATIRRSFKVDLDFVTHGAADQDFTLFAAFPEAPSPTAPNTGIGDIDDSAALVNPLTSIAGTLNTDTTDRVLSIEIAMSSANAGNEIRMEYSTIEVM